MQLSKCKMKYWAGTVQSIVAPPSGWELESTLSSWERSQLRVCGFGQTIWLHNTTRRKKWVNHFLVLYMQETLVGHHPKLELIWHHIIIISPYTHIWARKQEITRWGPLEMNRWTLKAIWLSKIHTFLTCKYIELSIGLGICRWAMLV